MVAEMPKPFGVPFEAKDTQNRGNNCWLFCAAEFPDSQAEENDEDGEGVMESSFCIRRFCTPAYDGNGNSLSNFRYSGSGKFRHWKRHVS